MAAGQGFKTFTTGEVLTAADVNGYLMQGINVFASSAARSAAITSPQEGQYSFLKDTNALEYYDGAAWVGAPVGDITAVTAGVGISGGGTSGTVTITNDMATTITASGDIVVGTGSGTYDNLPIGTTNQVLTADTTVSPYKVKWATPTSGGMTLISTTTLSGASVTLSSIPSTYKNLQLFFDNMTNSTADGVLRIAPNAGVDYAMASYLSSGTAGSYSASYIRTITNTTRTSDANGMVLTLFNYAEGDWIPYILTGGIFASSNYQTQFVTGYTYTGGANSISSLVISNSGGNWAGGTVKLYGVS